MTNKLRLRYAWGVLAGGILLMSILPGRSWLHQISALYYTSDWIRFFAYAAVASIPCVAWRGKKGVLCCFSAVGLCVMCGFLHTIAARPAGASGNILSELFGIAAGILLGLNLRFMGGSAGTVAGMARDRRQSTTL